MDIKKLIDVILTSLNDGKATNIDVYVSNASGILDMGQLLKSLGTRIGAKLTLLF